MKIISFFGAMWRKFVGRPKLFVREELCLSAMRGILSISEVEIFDHQIAESDLIQRQAGGARLCFFSSKLDGRRKLFKNKLPDQHVANIFLKSRKGAGAKKMRVKVFLHRGYFFSIEFPKCPRRYMRLHGIDENSLYLDKVEKIKEI
ncbi:hypothetical protein HF319_01895 [Xanthomonas sp. Kuri4-1]